jgi:hypothetical protein
MKMNRATRRAMLAKSRSKETKKNFEKAIGLALKLYESEDKVNDWLKTPAPAFGNNTPFQALLFGDSELVVETLKFELNTKRQAEKQVRDGAEQVAKILEQQRAETAVAVETVSPTEVTPVLDSPDQGVTDAVPDTEPVA